MRSRNGWLAGLCAAIFLTATSAWAQQNEPRVTQPQDQPTVTQQEATVHQKQHEDLASAGLFKASELMDLEVKNNAGEDLGKIEDVVFDAKTGKIRYAAISMGGFLGIGDKLVAVDWNSLQLMRRGQGDDAEFFARLDINKERMETAQAFDDNNWPTSSDQIWQTGAEGDVDVDVERDADQPAQPEAQPELQPQNQ